MNEILPPPNVHKKSKLKRPGKVAIWGGVITALLIIIPSYIFDMFSGGESKSIYAMMVILFLVVFGLFLSIYVYMIYQASYGQLVEAIQRVERREIDEKIYTRDLVQYTMYKHNINGERSVEMLLKSMVKKGYLPDYKYDINERCLVRIYRDENSFAAR